ncbi:MAG: non-canonical purine NTP pyrophosphatase [Phycisphaerales bacterium]|jgi:XTP/dITP diphosphohydrolase|nr:non-canonical purine NTP pyrophosphatase [Phycisphaerales bacterium]
MAEPAETTPNTAPAEPIVLATGNPHKVAEMRAILAPLGLAIATLADLSRSVPEPAETGDTFEANATIKALAYARATGRVCLADDSGLEVDALDGAPGVISSHFATGGVELGHSRETRDADNNRALLRALDRVPFESRGARFVCVMCLAAASPDAARRAGLSLSVPAHEDEPVVLVRVRGTFEGRIGLPGPANAGHPGGGVPRGTSGFGYDPLFLVAPAFVRTSAEFSPDEKNGVSHRGRAAALLADRLARLRTIR